MSSAICNRCSLLGYELNYLTIEGSKIPSRFLKVYKQNEVGIEGYDAGAEILEEFFREELQKYLKKDLLQTGKKIIDACLSGASIDDYNLIVPNSYSYSFNNMDTGLWNIRIKTLGEPEQFSGYASG